MRMDTPTVGWAGPCRSNMALQVNGQQYSLISHDDWERGRSHAGAPILQEPREVGRLTFNGTAYVVIEIQDEEIEIVEACPVLAPAADLLTRREFEVAMLVASGKCDKEIARALGISGYTVREHIRRTFAKLGVSRRTAIVSYVLRSLKPSAQI
jgi:DNA-binding CsgD family transcriptional regulator